VGQANFDAIWWLCLVIVICLFVAIVHFIFCLGKLRGRPSTMNQASRFFLS
jgi:hypothetical protein